MLHDFATLDKFAIDMEIVVLRSTGLLSVAWWRFV